MANKIESNEVEMRKTSIVLKALKNEVEGVYNQLEKSQNEDKSECDSIHLELKKEKISCISEEINAGIKDTELLNAFSKYTELIEAENFKLKMICRRQSDELGWLREELDRSTKLIESNEAEIVKLNNKVAEIKFQREMASVMDTINGISSESHTSSAQRPHESCKLSDNGKPLIKPLTKDKLPNKTMAMSAMTYSPRYNDLINASGNGSQYSPDYPKNLISMIGSSDERKLMSSTQSLVPNKFKTLHRLVIDYTQAKKYETAISLCHQAINDLESNPEGREQSEVAALLNILALVYRDQGKNERAAEILKEVVDIREKTLGPDNPLVAASLNNLSVLYAKIGKYAEAEPLCYRALKIREKVLGKNHFDVAKQLNNLALLYQGQGKFDLVEECFRRTLSIYEQSEPPRSHLVLRAKTSLASTCLKNNKFDQAESLLKDVLGPSPSPHPDFTTSPIIPVWKLAEDIASGKVKQSSYTLSDLAKLINMDTTMTENALHNMALVYKRRGCEDVMQVLRCWVSKKPSTTNPPHYPSEPHIIKSRNNNNNISNGGSSTRPNLQISSLFSANKDLNYMSDSSLYNNN